MKSYLTVKIFILGLILSLFITPSAKAASLNVAEGANVTLNGTFFVEGWAGAYSVIKQTVVDGIFMPKSQEWDKGSVWWNTDLGPGQNIQLDLGQTFNIESLIVQADDNDSYVLQYKNMQTGNWDLAWNIPVAGGWGMQTRPNSNDDTERYILSVPIITNALRISAGSQGDGWYSVSEIQAFGTPTPEPSSLILGFLSIGGLLGLKRRK
jgi:hypothetical protein